MIVEEFKEELEDFGNHLPIVVEIPSGKFVHIDNMIPCSIEDGDHIVPGVLIVLK